MNQPKIPFCNFNNRRYLDYKVHSFKIDKLSHEYTSNTKNKYFLKSTY